MQLTYRGNTYKMPASIQFAPVVQDQPKIKLTYRGQQYDYTSPVKQAKTVSSSDQVVALTYRGNTYQHPLQSINLVHVV